MIESKTQRIFMFLFKTGIVFAYDCLFISKLNTLAVHHHQQDINLLTYRKSHTKFFLFYFLFSVTCHML